MDLTERGASADRHPWEVQRFEAYRRILADHDALSATNVLDIGAGDGWFTDMLADDLPVDAVTVCWDVNYDDHDLEPSRPGQARTRDQPGPGHDLLLLLDVLEHIDEPAAFVRDSLVPITVTGTPVLVAVPAYQCLFGRHDEALGHHRRYARHELLDQLAPWIDVIEHGSLFTSLLLPRAAAVVAERRRQADRVSTHGVGNWTAGPVSTALANGVLAADARIGRVAARAGLRLPGLSHWAFGVGR